MAREPLQKAGEETAIKRNVDILFRFSAVASMILAGTLGFLQRPVQAADVPSGIHIYSVKYLCGYLEEDPFPNIYHFTEINIHNPSNNVTASIRGKYITITPPETRIPFSFLLEPNRARSIDCTDIVFTVGLWDVKGFVVIESNSLVSVVAVYDKCTVPLAKAQFPPPVPVFIDIFPASVAYLEVAIPFGTRTVNRTVKLEGPTVIQRSPLALRAGQKVASTEIKSMNLVDSTGRFVLSLDPFNASKGEIAVKVVKGEVFSINSFFDVFFTLQTPFGTWFNKAPFRLTAELTNLVPGPATTIGDRDPNRYVHTGEATLYDAVTGLPVATIVKGTHLPIAQCVDSSIDVEYVAPQVVPPPPGPLQPPKTVSVPFIDVFVPVLTATLIVVPIGGAVVSLLLRWLLARKR